MCRALGQEDGVAAVRVSLGHLSLQQGAIASASEAPSIAAVDRSQNQRSGRRRKHPNGAGTSLAPDSVEAQELDLCPAAVRNGVVGQRACTCIPALAGNTGGGGAHARRLLPSPQPAETVRAEGAGPPRGWRSAPTQRLLSHRRSSRQPSTLLSTRRVQESSRPRSLGAANDHRLLVAVGVASDVEQIAGIVRETRAPGHAPIRLGELANAALM
jgi:hypothetical protein